MLRTCGTRRGNGGGTGLYPSIMVSQSEYFIDFIVILVYFTNYALHKICMWFAVSLSHTLFSYSFLLFGVFFCPFNIYLCGIYFNLFAFAFALNMYLLPRCVCVFFLFFIFLCVIFVIIINYYWPLLRCVCISLISCKLCVISSSVSAAAAAAAPL